MLDWLPERSGWAELLENARNQLPPEALGSFQLLVNSRMDFVRAIRIDKAFQRYRAQYDLSGLLPSLRLAVIGSSTLSHLGAGIRLAGLRRGILIDIYEGPYGMYRQELMDSDSGLHRFRPEAVLIALDAHALAEMEGASAQAIVAMIKSCWRIAQEKLHCTVVQQTLLPIIPPVLGNQEYQYPSSATSIVSQVNQSLREEAQRENVVLLTVDCWAAQDGLTAWFDPALWYRSKQEVHPRASNIYGDQVARLLAALRGISFKCLVLDLDNTMWGGVVGDDGVDGITIGQGSEAGEAYLALQRYAKRLSERGVILAVCSKNDEANALRPFDERPEMILRRSDIACFVADWDDKAANLKRIAERLNIGLNTLVFVDDNPVERNLVRRELPMVAVPELPENPADYVACLAAAGYFESLSITEEDRERSREYRANIARDELRSQTTDMAGFLSTLQTKLLWSHFELKDIKRVVQLINKTNQFNLTTRRYTEPEVRALVQREDMLTLQIRILDVYGNSGIIAILIGQRTSDDVLFLDSWLMSCRVLGRNVERATLTVLTQEARALGCTQIIGVYKPSARNQLVQAHYEKLGFTLYASEADGTTQWAYPLDQSCPPVEEIEIFKEEDYGATRNLLATH